MNENIEPQRLLDDPSVLGSLRGDLSAVTASPPLRYDVELGLARFRAQLSAGATPTGGQGGPLAVGKVVVGIAGLLVVAGVAWALLSGGPESSSVAFVPSAASQAVSAEAQAPGSTGLEPTPEPAPAVSSAPAATAVVAPELAAPAPEPEADASPEPSPGAEPDAADEADAAQPAGTAARGNKRREASGDASDFLQEARQVQLAKKTLETDPKRTLRLLDDIQREFPRGQLREERQGLRVLALIASGEQDEGKRRAEAYLARYPRGTLATRVRRALDELP